MIGSKFSSHFCNQSEVKTKPIWWLACAHFPALCVAKVKFQVQVQVYYKVNVKLIQNNASLQIYSIKLI